MHGRSLLQKYLGSKGRHTWRRQGRDAPYGVATALCGCRVGSGTISGTKRNARDSSNHGKMPGGDSVRQKMETILNMIYWRGEKFWVGKLLEHPEIMTQGKH